MSNSKKVFGRKITRNEFFYVLQDNYDESAELAIPFYREMHTEITNIVQQIWSKTKSLNIIDLGAGTGKTSAVLLDSFPKSKLLAIDLFDEMLDHARRRLDTFPNQIEYKQSDFMSYNFGLNKYDLCVSALAIHHQTKLGKQELFKKIYNSLVKGGRFLLIDWTKFNANILEHAALYSARSNISKKIQHAETVSLWIKHWKEKNIPDSISDITNWLEIAGFSNVDCVVRHYGMALIYAEKL